MFGVSESVSERETFNSHQKKYLFLSSGRKGLYHDRLAGMDTVLVGYRPLLVPVC